MDEETKRLLAIRWFQSHGFSVTEDDGSLFLEIRKESFQLSSAEVSYRAELQAALS